jgi:hypothetical protein
MFMPFPGMMFSQQPQGAATGGPNMIMNLFGQMIASAIQNDVTRDRAQNDQRTTSPQYTSTRQAHQQSQDISGAYPGAYPSQQETQQPDIHTTNEHNPRESSQSSERPHPREDPDLFGAFFQGAFPRTESSQESSSTRPSQPTGSARMFTFSFGGNLGDDQEEFDLSQSVICL